MFRKLNGLGWPVGLQMGMETASFSLSTIMVGWLGTIALASHPDCAHYFSVHLYDVLKGLGARFAVRVQVNFEGAEHMVNVRVRQYAGYHLICNGGVLLSIVFLLRNQVGAGLRIAWTFQSMVSSLFLPFLVYLVCRRTANQLCLIACVGIADVKPIDCHCYLFLFCNYL